MAANNEVETSMGERMDRLEGMIAQLYDLVNQQAARNLEGPSNQEPSNIQAPTHTAQASNVNVGWRENPTYTQGIEEDEAAKLKAKMQKMEETLKTLQGVHDFGNTNIEALCLFPKIQIPPKFKPEFTKYEGKGCPKAHLAMYCRKMAQYADNEPLIMHFFQESLIGAADIWFSTLDKNKIRTWDDLASAFLKHYAFNTFLAPTREDLGKMSKRNDESFKIYAQRWRTVASQVQPPLTDQELTTTFIRTMKGTYRDRLSVCSTFNFHEVVAAGEGVEEAIKSGELLDMSAMKRMMEQL